MGRRTHACALATTLLALVASACVDDTVTPPSDGSEPPPAAGSPHLGLVEVTIRGIRTETPSATAISASSVAELERLQAERGTPAGGIALQSLEPPVNEDDSGDGTIQLEPVSTGSFTDGVPGDDGVRYVYATFRVRNAQSDGTPYNTGRQNLTFLSADTDNTYGQTAISQLRLFDGTTLSSAVGTPIAEGMIPTGAVHQASGELTSTEPDVLQVFDESEVDPDVIDPPAGVETIFPYGFIVRHETSTSTRALPASPEPEEFIGVVTFAFTVPLQPTSAEDPFEISAVFLAVDDSDTRITQSLEEQNSAGQLAFEDRAASLGAGGVNLLPGGSYTGAIASRLVCPVRTSGTAGSPSALLVSGPEFISLSPDPYAPDGSGSHITLPTFIAASFSDAVEDADANTFVVHGAQTGRHFLDDAYGGNGSATVTSPEASANAFFPGEEIEVSLTPGLGACPAHVARLRVGVNAGSGTFSTPANYDIGDEPWGVAVGDMDGDGNLDIATANSNSDDVSVLPNDGNGTFATAVDNNVGDRPSDIALGDLDGDGDLDITTANGFSDDVSVLLNDGIATFATAVNYDVGSPNFIALGDLDGDGDLDIATANFGFSNVSVLLNEGGGTFATAVNYDVGNNPNGIAVGDFNGDGDLDIATANSNSDDVSVLLNNGNGTFATMVDYNLGNANSPWGIAVGDLDGDGNLDIATANSASDDVSVLLNDGNGTIAPAVNYDVGNNPGHVAVGDLDGDGDLDIATANFSSDDVSVLLNNGNGTFATMVNYNAGVGSLGIAVGDLDGDGDLDIATANLDSDNVSVLLNNELGSEVGTCDDPIVLVQESVSVAEGDSGSQEVSVEIAVNVGGDQFCDVRLFYETRDGSAVSGQDYVPIISTSAGCFSGDHTLSVTVDVLGDAVVESDETFEVHVTEVEQHCSAPLGETASATVTILDDDGS